MVDWHGADVEIFPLIGCTRFAVRRSFVIANYAKHCIAVVIKALEGAVFAGHCGAHRVRTAG